MSDERLTGSAWSASEDATTVPSGTADESPEVEALTEDIEETRTEMANTVEAIADRLDPANIAEDAKQTVRDATVGKVEQMASNVADTASGVMEDARTTAMDTGSGIVDTIRRNPIPAAMAGIGIGWLVMNRGGGSSGRRRMDSRGSWQYDRYGYGTQSGRADMWGGRQAHPRGDSGGNPLEGVGQQAGQVAGQVGENVGRFADQARDTMGRMPDQFGETFDDVRGNAQRMMEDNPMAFGALALAVGAALGMALPETRAEQKVLAPIGEKAVETAEQAADEATRQLETSRS